MELVKFRARTDEALAAHLTKALLNATYSSKTIQNHRLCIIGQTVRDAIIQEINDAHFFTILVDEVTDCGNLEQLSIAI